MDQREEEQFLQNEQGIRQQGQNVNQNKILLEQQQMAMQQEEVEKSLIKEQLDLTEEIERIEHLLKGHIIKRDEYGNGKWVEPTDPDMILLTEAGINYIMWAIQWYLNKNTLLSNYDDKQINAKMEDVATTIADNLFMKYNIYFKQPTLEECKDEIGKRMKKKKEIRIFAEEIIGKEADAKEIEKEIKKEMEETIERELEVIRQQKTKDKYKMYESLIRFIQDTIHSTYQRAWKGQERTTIRQHINISEIRSPNQPQVVNRGGRFDFLRRR